MITLVVLYYCGLLILTDLYGLSAPRKDTHGPFFWTLHGTVREI